DVLRVDAVAEAGARRAAEAVVVDDVSVGFLVGALAPHTEPVARVVVDDEVDEAAARAVGVDAHDVLRAGVGVGHLEAPVPGVAAVDGDGAVDGGALARILADHDGSARAAGERALEAARVGATPEPDGIAGLDPAV